MIISSIISSFSSINDEQEFAITGVIWVIFIVVSIIGIVLSIKGINREKEQAEKLSEEENKQKILEENEKRDRERHEQEKRIKLQEDILRLEKKYAPAVNNLIEKSSPITRRSLEIVTQKEIFTDPYTDFPFVARDRDAVYCSYHADDAQIYRSIAEVKGFVRKLKETILDQDRIGDSENISEIIYFVIRNNVIRYWHDYYLKNNGWATLEEMCDHTTNIEEDLSLFTYYIIYEDDITQSINKVYREIGIDAMNYIKDYIDIAEEKIRITEESKYGNKFFEDESISKEQEKNSDLLKTKLDKMRANYQYFQYSRLFREDSINGGTSQDLSNKNPSHMDVSNIDDMEGHDFEEFVARIFRMKGYRFDVTPKSGDYGVDIIAAKGFERIAIQCKRYENKVPNDAVQEVVAGMTHYRCTDGMVVTNNYFQPSAITLANENRIILWDRDRLLKEMKSVFAS